MELPLQITFRNMPHTDAVEAKIRGRAGKLTRFCDSIIGCRVSIDSPRLHHAAGNQYLVRVELTVPGETLVANREPDAHRAYTDVYVAIRDAFDAVRGQLEEYEGRRQGQVKAQETPALGRIVELNPGEDYGRIATPDTLVVCAKAHNRL